MSDATTAPSAAGLSGGESQARLRRRMSWLLGLTFLHVVGEGGIALFDAIRTGSLALLAFALESVIEGGAAVLAARHLHHLADEEEDHARRDQILARWSASPSCCSRRIRWCAEWWRLPGDAPTRRRASSGSCSRSSRRSGCPSSATSNTRPAGSSGARVSPPRRRNRSLAPSTPGRPSPRWPADCSGRRGGSTPPCRCSWF